LSSQISPLPFPIPPSLKQVHGLYHIPFLLQVLYL